MSESCNLLAVRFENHVEGGGACDWEQESIRLWVTFGFFAQVQFGGHPGLTRRVDGFVKEKNKPKP
jgi:hypothetical protein